MKVKVVVVTFDCLPASLLGCYGSEWVETPNFDRLAADSVVFDQHLGTDFCPIDSTSILRHAWWTGASIGNGTPFVDNLRSAGVRTCVLSEPALVGEADRLPGDASLIRHIEPRGIAKQTAGDLPFAQIVDVATDRVAEWSDEPELLWLMSCGLPDEPSAPDDFLDIYADDFDPDDERLFNAAYITFLDHCFGKLLNAIAQANQSSVAIIVSAAQGMPASTPEQIEGPKIELSNAITRTPFMICSPDPVALSGNRSAALTQTTDMAATIAELFGVSTSADLPSKSLSPVIRGQVNQHRDELLMQLHHTGWQSLRSQTWYFVQDFEADDESNDDDDNDEVPRSSWLFSKPEDVWDCHDVKADFHDVALEMSRRLRQ